MKTKFLALLFAITLVAAGADLQIADGRIFKDYRIISQTATTVTVRYADGIAKVEKTKLPPDLLAQYPVDEKAAAAEAAETAKGKALYKAQANALVQKQEHVLQARASAALPGKIMAAVRARADSYFKSEYGSRSPLIFELEIELNPPRPIDGWTITYEVTGVAWYRYYESVWGGSSAIDHDSFTARVECSTVRGADTIKVTNFTPRVGPPL